MRVTLTLVVALLAAACSKPEAAPPPPAPPTPATPTPAPVVDDFREVDLSQRARRAPARELSERWLIILDSEGDEAKRADRLKKLAALDVDSAPMTFSSTELKGLMPCYEVLIAAHFKDRKEAIDYSKKLTAAGVGNYPKNAGKYVGRQPAVEAYCARKARGADAGGCGGGLFLAVSEGGRTFVHLALPEVERARALERAPKPRPLDGPSTWIQPLQAAKLGALRAGDALTVLGARGATRACKVKAFAALTRGTPHFSMTERDGPSCGEPALFAELDCHLAGASAAWTAAAKVAVGAPVDPKTGQAFAPDDKLLATAAAARARGRAHAGEQGKPLDEAASDRRWSLDGAVLQNGRLKLTTGEGFSECGGPDFKVELDGWSRGGEVLRALNESYQKETLGVLSVDGAPVEVYREHFGDLAIRALEGGERCRLDKPFCDCGC